MREDLSAFVDFVAGMRFHASTGTGHDLEMDAGPRVGGENSAARPMEVLLVALGGCTGMDVISVLRKMRQDVTGYQVRVSGDQAAEHPRVFTDIHLEHVVRGRNLNADLVKRAIELSSTRYCSVEAMLRHEAHILETYRMVDEDTGDELQGTLSSD